MTEISSQPKYPKPKILLIDVEPECEAALRAAGYNVSVGSFGIPYRAPRSEQLYWVTSDSSRLPNIDEQEVIVLNTKCLEATGPAPQSRPGDGVSVFWQSAEDGEIDPRPLVMSSARQSFEKILSFGGIFIIQLAARYNCKYVRGRGYGKFRVSEETSYDLNSWCFLDVMNSVNTSRGQGKEITFERKHDRLTRILEKGASKALYSCIVGPDYSLQNNWLTLAKNKYGEAVAGLLTVGAEPHGNVLLLPQMPKFGKVLVQLLEEFCTQWSPNLFPFHEGQRWMHQRDYEVPDVTELLESIDQVEAEAAERLKQLSS